jgi:cobalamin biosynthesis protein CobW
MRKIPATVVTGFLGAGKTTIIRNLLAKANGRRIALIVNEFGDVGVDGNLLKGCGLEACADDDIIELANGCICCTVADDFVPTMEKLLGREERRPSTSSSRRPGSRCRSRWCGPSPGPRCAAA